MAYADFFKDLSLELSTEKAEIEAKEAKIVEAQDDIALEIKKSFDAGVEEGKGMIQLPDPQDPQAQYTQAQLSAAVTAGKAQQRSEDETEFQPQIDTLKTEVDGLKAELAKKDDEKAEALKAMEEKLEATIADIKEKFDAMQSKEDAAEAEFAANLAPKQT